MIKIVPLWLVAALGASLQGYYLTQLPERVAVHFNSSGEPDRWDTPLGAAVPAWVVLSIFPLLGSALVLLLSKIPPQFINLPNKEYWLDPTRRADTIAWLQRFFALFLLVPVVTLIAVFHCGYEYNMGHHAATSWPVMGSVIAVAAGLIFTGIVIILRKFNKT